MGDKMVRYSLIISLIVVASIAVILLTQFSFTALYNQTLAELKDIKSSLSEVKSPSKEVPTKEVTSKVGKEYKVIIEKDSWDPNSGKSYSPKEIKIKVGDTITFINEDGVAHDLKHDTFYSGFIMPGKSWSYTFKEAGTYNYLCASHPWMTGKIIVEDGQQVLITQTTTQTATQPLVLSNIVKDPKDIPPPIDRTENKLVKITLIIKEVVAEIDDGVYFEFWAFNGTVPGPLIRVMEGDTVEITLVNPSSNKMAHNIDLHAVNGPGGGAAVTLVKPGESKTFRFKALNTGAYIYHCAAPLPPDHIARGMYGVILVEPKGGLPKVDREFYVVQGEWYLTSKDKGLQTFDRDKALQEHPVYITFNGRVNSLNMEAKVGEKVRIIFGVGGPNIGSNFHVIGEIFDKVYLGSPSTYIANEETVYVAPGAAGIFEFKLDVPGKYTLVDHALYRILKGALGYINVTGPPNEEIFYPQP